MDKTVVLYPSLGVGHLTPMVQLAKLFARHGVAVTVALVEQQVESPCFSAAVARAAATNPSVTFHVLPPPPAAAAEEAPRGRFDYLRLMDAPLRDFLRSLPAVHALVLDMFCAGSLDVAADLGIPAYFFFASGASFLAVFLNLPSVAASMDRSFAELGDALFRLPVAPPFKATDLPQVILDNDEASKATLRIAERIAESSGILINTFEPLEARAVRDLRDGLCIPGRPTPPVYCIGPLVTEGGDKKHECLEWLDAQPDNSVTFLSFGSLGTFSKKQLEEIAVGLERSGQRFLWVVRSPLGDEQSIGDPLPEPDLDALLPEGFLERTKHQGLVVRSWAPQVEVLGHRATGAFMTHCGWNSTLEGITAGLPLLCWPLYAEQRLNKVFIVEEMKLGVVLRGYDEEVVKDEEVEAKVRWVMDSEGGRALRERAMAEKSKAVQALSGGGSSQAAFVEFLKNL
ncbi:anthocyanidin 5,3-O-glucosyltransferase-like [Panicum miliaceum]|uniref:Glycosyltransferase n=1 Tax=Panicum miliaceum TaxID=4540 RepID=A0A3L6R1K8_PANMI|nr:anthocyanidin 5,3-O-glucosyltransferase-like [Panicum miliaceum]